MPAESQLTDLRLGLPVVEHALTIGFLIVIGDTDLLHPVLAVPGDPSVPGASTAVAPVALLKTAVDLDPVGLLADRQLQSVGAMLELRRANIPGHDVECPSACPSDGRRLA